MNRFLAILCFTLSMTTVTTSAAENAYDLGRKAVARGDHKAAVELFERAVAANPRNALYHYQLGGAYGMAAASGGMFGAIPAARKARAAFERAVELDPNYLPARFALLEFNVAAPAIFGGSEAGAMEQAGEIRKRDPIEGHRAFARIYVAAKNLELARGEYEAMIRSFPRSPRAHYLFALHLLTVEKNFTSALAELQTVLQLDDRYMAAHFRLGQLAAVSGTSFADGERALKKYVAYVPADDEPSLARAWFWLGAIYEKQGRRADAKASYASSLRLNPTQKDAKEALTRVSS